MTNAVVVIPFRDRGIDPQRNANLKRVLEHWSKSGIPTSVVDDQRVGDAQFNRSAAYNIGSALSKSDVVVYAESDVLVDYTQIREGIDAAMVRPGLVIPFTELHHLNESDSWRVRNNWTLVNECQPEQTFDNGASIGAVNIVSRATLELVGQWDETFEGGWYDDNAMFHAFEVATGRPIWIKGPAYHLYHLPSWHGPHLTEADRNATHRNKLRMDKYLDTTDPDRIRELTAGGA